MRVLFIVNPVASRGRGYRRWQALAPQLLAHGNFDVALTAHRGHATQLAREAAEKGYTRVAAVGGDGTVFEVVNGLIGADTALAVLPAGTGNDYARFVGMPSDLFEAAKVVLTGVERPVDIGALSTGHHFVNVAGVGFDAEVAQAVNRIPKRLGGTLPYLLGLATTLWGYQAQEMEIAIDDRAITQKTFLAAIGVGASYGGGMMITPSAVLDDGFFEVCVAADMSPLEVIKLVPTIYNGTHIHHEKVTTTRGRSISIRSKGTVAAQADGELVGHLPLQITIKPRALRLICPDFAAPAFAHRSDDEQPSRLP